MSSMVPTKVAAGNEHPSDRTAGTFIGNEGPAATVKRWRHDDKTAVKAAKIDAFLRGRCRRHRQEPVFVKGHWTPKDDAILERLVRERGVGKWNVVPGRTRKQCRERWRNYLAPDICRRPWSRDEDRTILRHHMSNGNRWADIAKLLLGR